MHEDISVVDKQTPHSVTVTHDEIPTPWYLVDFIVSCVEPQKTDRVLDPACGTGGFLVSAYRHIMTANTMQDNPDNNTSAVTPEEHSSLCGNLTGYDISPGMVAASRENLFSHGIPGLKVYEHDVLTCLERWGERYDTVLTHLPLPYDEIQSCSRYRQKSNSSAIVFLHYILGHLTRDGKAGIIVSEEVLTHSGKEYADFRRLLLKNGLHTVISLSPKTFKPYSGAKTVILLIDRRIAGGLNSLLLVKLPGIPDIPMATGKSATENDLSEALEVVRKWKVGKQTVTRMAMYVNKSNIPDPLKINTLFPEG